MVKYEEVVAKRKSSVMCRIKGFRDKSCTTQEVRTKERPEVHNVTRVIPECCPGYIRSSPAACVPVCDPPCQRGVCLAPDLCQDQGTPQSLPIDKAALDYYDENATETSTLPEETETSWEGETDWGSTESVTEPDYEQSTVPEEDDSEEATEGSEVELVDDQGEIQWMILWTGVSVSAVLILVLGFILYKKITRMEQEEGVVIYKK